MTGKKRIFAGMGILLGALSECREPLLISLHMIRL